MLASGDEVEAGVGVDAEVEMVDVEVGTVEVEMVEEVETVEVETVEMVEGLPLLPPSSRLLPPCRVSVTILAAFFPYFGGVASH